MLRLRFIAVVVALLPTFAVRAQEARSLQDFCRNVVRHVPSADATYRPGVDVRGKPVAPADLPSSGAIVLPEVIEIPLDIPLSQLLGPATPAWAAHVDAKLGTMTVNTRTGEVSYNGRPLQDIEAADLIAACHRATGTR